MARSVNNRGFAVYDEFRDTSGNAIRVQESSSPVDALGAFIAEHEEPAGA